jgi:anti-sigma regulatory factor (Ser/Thr protein kinase)
VAGPPEPRTQLGQLPDAPVAVAGEAWFHASYAAKPHAVPLARRAIAELAASAGAAPGRVDAVRLAVSEAITNAIVHGYRGRPGMVHLGARVSRGRLSVTVRDEGGGLGPPPSRPGLGIGWRLIEEACEQFAVVEHAGGIELRMQLALGDHSG